MNIRPAILDDFDAVKACAEQAYALYVPRMGRNPAPMVADFGAQISAGHVHVIEVDGVVAGFIVLYPRLGYSETGRHEEDGFARVFYRKEL